MTGFLVGTDPGLRQTRTPTVDVLTDGVGYTSGSSTTITLTDDPGTENHVVITFDGVVQHHDTYSQSGAVITFDAAIPSGVAKIEAIFAVTVASVTVPDASVATAKLADDAVTLAKIASGTDGELITWDASGDPSAVPVGTATHVLTSNGAGAAPTFQAAGGGWAFVSQTVASSDASIAFTGFETGYDYKIEMAHFLPGTDIKMLWGFLGITGPTYRTAGYLGGTGGVSSAAAANINLLSVNIQLCYTAQGNVAGEQANMSLTLYDPANASTKTAFVGVGGGHDSSTLYDIVITNGFYNTAAEAHTAFKLNYATGNIASGTFTLYRRANA